MRLTVDELCAIRGGRTLFQGLAFAVEAGGALLITGPNGAGKTTLLRSIAGLMRPAAGRIALDGGLPDHGLGEQCHYVGHPSAIKATLTVRENAGFWGRFLGGEGKRLDGALDTVGLSPLRDIPAGYLSAGQKRRLGLARLLLAERPLWLLDEPTASLDSAAQEILIGVVNAHLAAGGLAVAATHMPLGFTNARELRLGGGAA